ncbi:IS110 family transposase [Paenibacillus fonticola]|uniref:IS110 family transposase n=1 Tax=Paenibacillus fonticola TaxID=379896 RepID=UPI001F0ACE3F|nr:IS110 family transposase [Paenibacillus fonticola]
MKFTRNHVTNQRIERITNHHAVVGIDIAKDTHAAQMTDFRGRVLTYRHLSFPNIVEGFERLLRWIQDAQVNTNYRLSSLVWNRPGTTGLTWRIGYFIRGSRSYL